MLANLTLIILNLSSVAISAMLAEYEISKLTNPLAAWLPTNPALDLSLEGSIILLGIINLGVLFFVFLRKLDFHRAWLWKATVLNFILLAILVLILGKKFLPILLP